MTNRKTAVLFYLITFESNSNYGILQWRNRYFPRHISYIVLNVSGISHRFEECVFYKNILTNVLLFPSFESQIALLSDSAEGKDVSETSGILRGSNYIFFSPGIYNSNVLDAFKHHLNYFSWKKL
jgi:hypothetical protein